MNSLTHENLVDLVEETSRKNKELEKAQQSTANYVESTADRFAGKSSQVLAGIIGGALGSVPGAMGYIFGAPTALTGLGGAIAVIAGVALAMYRWRGHGWHKIEKAKAKLVSSIAIVKEELTSLPEDAPQEARDNLWDTYNKLLMNYQRIAIDGLN